ncbi:alpha/beta hydrolase [Draconibacterium sp.]|nr:alpha/beta hydrolase [Draconibacterium sp.]
MNKKLNQRKKKTIIASLLLVFLVINFTGNAQLESTILGTSRNTNVSDAMFFTNRPIQVNKDNSYTFLNKFVDKTNTLYFCSYDFETDSIYVNARTVNLSKKYPTEKIKHNFFYESYKYQRLEKGIKRYYIIVGGYGKSFKKQVQSYMQRLKSNYGDSLFNKAVIDVFAWGTEEEAYKYYNAVRKSKNGANDFAIFQHMLDEFMSDSVFWKNNPKDISFTILFSSMGNNLFKEYLEERARQNIPLVKTYYRILFVGSVAPRNAFEKGEAFHNLHEMADTVDVFVNSKDMLLKMSSVAHLKNRMGNKGPKKPDELPGYINVHDIKYMITKKDMSGLGHDYLLTNPVLQDALLEAINTNVENMNK